MTEQELLDQANALGVTVSLVSNLPSSYRGGYSKAKAAIFIKTGMSEIQRICTLAHELEHVRRGHDGHQDRCTENTIDEAVALQLVSPAEYLIMERLYEGNLIQIAKELDLTPDIIAAYQRALAKHR